MAKSIHLYQLVKSLDRSEKRYFRLFCQHSSGKAHYQVLFDALAKQKKYDEKALRAQFAQEKFFKNFHLTKRYLYDLILKALRNYHATISAKANLQDQLRNVEILYQRGLFAQCEPILHSIESKALHFQLPYILLDLYKWRRKLIQISAPSDRSSMLAITKQQLQAIESLQIEQSLRRHMLGEEQEIGLLQDHWYVYNQTLWANLIYFKSIRTQAGEGEATLALRKALQQLGEQPHLIRENPNLWATSLNNLLAALVWNKRYAEAIEWIEQAKSYFFSFKKPDPPLLRLILRTFNLELEMYRDTRNFTAAQVCMQEIEKYLQADEKAVPVSYLLSFWYQFAYLYFLQANYDKTLHWINLILNQNLPQGHHQIVQNSRWLNLMVHLELKNFFVLRYFVDNTRRSLQKSASLGDIERILLRFFSRASRLAEHDLPEAFQRLHQEIFAPTNDQLSHAFQERFLPLQEWIMGKVVPRKRAKN